MSAGTSTRFLNAEEAAEFLGGLNARTLTRWAREGYLPAFPIGEGKRRLWRFLRDDLEAWMMTRRQGGQNAFRPAKTRVYTLVSHRCPSQEQHD